MDGAIKPLIMLVESIDEDFDLKECVDINVLLERLKESLGNAKIKVIVKPKVFNYLLF